MSGIQEITVFSYLRSASSWFSANYTIDQPGRFLFCKIQEEAPRGGNCLLLPVTGYAHALTHISLLSLIQFKH